MATDTTPAAFTPMQWITLLEQVAADVGIKPSQVLHVMQSVDRYSQQLRAELELQRIKKAAETALKGLH